jgi:SAM-dependent methyltransferase
MAEVPKRAVWAARQLEVAPADRILEVGCGDGSALSLILPRLTAGRAVGVDRSAVAIKAAARRNADAVRTGRLTLVQAEIAELRLDERFTKAFALNVNVFWHRPRKELAVLRDLLGPDGRLFLMFEPPAAEQVPHFAELCRRNLEANDFVVEDELRANLPASAALLLRARVD